MKKFWLIINLNKHFYIRVGNKIFPCQIGMAGLKDKTKKIEGDKATPIGKWLLQSLYYRSDRILRPRLKKKNALKINHITKDCGWCDDLGSNYYNKHINLKNFTSFNFKYEKLWREDGAYDLIIVISHNTKPIIKNKGSAIFIHCSFSDNRKTAGCVAMKRKDLIYLLKNIKGKTYLKI